MSKFLSALFLQPLSLIWAIFIGMTLWRLVRKRWWAALASGSLAVFLYVVGATKLPAWLLATLERPYAGTMVRDLEVADAVVVLGGMSSASANDVFETNLSTPADRVVAAMEVLRQRKARALVIGGAGPPPGRSTGSEGERLRDWVGAWDVGRAPVFLLGPCATTRDEALRTRVMAVQEGWRKLILITSASHMGRAEAVFRKAGVKVIPFACDFEGLSALENEDRYFRPLPGPGGFVTLQLYLHEIVGRRIYRWREWL